MTILEDDFLAVIHKHQFAVGVFGTKRFPSTVNRIPYTYAGGGIMSMSDMYYVVNFKEKAMAADKAGTWPQAFEDHLTSILAEVG